MEENNNVNPQTTEPVVKKIGDIVTASDIIRVMADFPANTSAKKPLSVSELRTALDLFKDAVIQEVGQGHRVQLNGFVSFVPSYRSPRKGNNVITNEPMDIPEGIQVTAKAGSLLRKAIKNLGPDAIQEFKALSKKGKAA